MRIGRITLPEGGAQFVCETPEDGLCPVLHRDGRPITDPACVDPASPPCLGDPIVDPHWTFPISPGKIVGVGLNYSQHADESAVATPASPLLFAKFPSSLTGPYSPISIDATLTGQVDWEVELGVVVGRQMRNVPEEHALDHVLGYTVVNDVSARDVQFSDGQWTRGKSFDTFCPLGPVIVTPDELGPPDDLSLRLRVNGETLQDDTTRNMIASVPELLSFCSRNFTLAPGDLLLTGTPAGCGHFMKVPRYLHPGDIVEAEVAIIGALRNPVVSSPSGAPS